jgi:hypothetical protein
MATQITGTVVEVKLERQDDFVRRSSYDKYTPVQVKATIELTDGRLAYVSTKVGEDVFYAGIGPFGSYAKHVSGGQEKAQFPWVIEGQHKMAFSQNPQATRAGVGYQDEFILVIWRDDVVTLEGEFAARKSARGNEYVIGKRIKVVAWSRPGWEPEPTPTVMTWACPVCDEVFTDADGAAKHIAAHFAEPDCCSECGEGAGDVAPTEIGNLCSICRESFDVEPLGSFEPSARG